MMTNRYTKPTLVADTTLEYQRGLADRKKRGVLHTAEYKYTEVKRYLHRYKHQLEKIGQINCGDTDQAFWLLSCSFEERNDWAKDMPKYITYILGRDITGTTDGLLGDGLTESCIALIKEIIDMRVPIILQQADYANRSPVIFSRDFGTHNCAITKLIDLCIQLIEEIEELKGQLVKLLQVQADL